MLMHINLRVISYLSSFVFFISSFLFIIFFFFSSRRRHTRSKRDWSSDVCSSDLDFHTRFQKIAMMDTTTGELVTRRLEHGTGEAERFYAALAAPVRVGIEATLATQWFEKMLRHYGHELWIGDAAEIRAAMVRKQKTDDRDALHILDLLMQNRFPRIWVPSPAERDVRQLVRHRHKLVRFRTSVMNQLHALAMGQGLCLRKKLWTTVGDRKSTRLNSSHVSISYAVFCLKKKKKKK